MRLMTDRPREVLYPYSVAEAALLLEVSAEAVRGRVKRGTLKSERDGVNVHVLLPIDRTEAERRLDVDRTHDQTTLIEELRDRIASLEGQIVEKDRQIERTQQQRGREAERYQDLLAALTAANRQLSERVPELRAAESPPAPSEASTSTPTPPRTTGEPQEAGERRSWFSRMFSR